MHQVASTTIALFALFSVISADTASATDIDSIDFPTSIKSAVTELDWTFRQSTCNVTGGPCEMNDPKCMSMMALRYLNEFRRENGKSPLRQGTVNQFKNAVNQSRTNRDAVELSFQNLAAADIGCGSSMRAEIFAHSDCRRNNDPARQCFDVMHGSSVNRMNMLGDHEAASMGIVFATGGVDIWCTHTFTTSTQYASTGGCAPLSGNGGEAGSNDKPAKPLSVHDFESYPPPTPKRALKRPCDYFIRKQFYKGLYLFKATPKRGKCKYCIRAGKCLSVALSKKINRFFKRSKMV